MRTLLYLALIVLVFVVGTRIEDAQTPAPAAVEPQEKVAELPESPEAEVAQEPEETETQVSEEAEEPPPLLGAVEQAPTQPEVKYTQEYTQLLEEAIHDGINVERVRAGLSVLSYDEELAEIAAGHSTDMAKENYFAHEDDDGCSSSCRLDNAGYKWRWVGENLFLLRSSHRYAVEEAAAIIVQGWMGSEGHRKNVMSKNFTHEGLGVVIDGNSIYATEVFSRPR